MTFVKRLNKLEVKVLPEKKIIVVKYGNQLQELKFHGELFTRLANESEKQFVARVRNEVSQMQDRPHISVLVGNF